MSLTSKTCANCLCELTTKKYVGFLRKCHNREFTVISALQGMYNHGSQVLFPDEIDNSPTTNKALCLNCANALAAAYCNKLKFNSLSASNSYVTERLKNDNPVTPEPDPEPSIPLPTPTPKITPATPRKKRKRRKVIPKTPLNRKIKKYLKNVKSAYLLRNNIKSNVRKEMISLQRFCCLNTFKLSRDNFHPTNEAIKTDLRTYAPTIYAILKGMMYTSSENNAIFKPQVRSVMGIAMQAFNSKAIVFQKSVGIAMFSGKASIKTFQLLNKLGICASYDSVKRLLVNLTDDHDTELYKFKRDRTFQLREWTEKSTGLPTPYNQRNSDLDKSLHIDTNNSARRRILFESKESESFYYGAKFSIDNINHVPQTLHHSSKHKTTPMNMTSGMFVHNRIPQPLDNVFQKPLYTKAMDVPLTAFIPTPEDMSSIKKDHEILIKRILVKHLEVFNPIQNDKSIIWYIPHQYSELSGKKSEVKSLGIMDIDQSTTDGTIRIIKELRKYFPIMNEKVMPMVVGGDALTCDLFRSTLFHLFNSDCEEEKLEGPVTSVGGFHLRFALMTDIVRLLFSQSDGSPGKGTVGSLRAMFGHHEKLKDVKHNFHLTTRFFQFCLTSYLCAAAMKALDLDIESFEDKKTDLTNFQRLEMLQKAVDSIMNFQWIDVFRNTNQTTFCLCNSEFEKDDKRKWIGCDNNNCKYHLWYHIDCLNGEENHVVGGFNIPPKRITKSSRYYCTEECKVASEDSKASYSKALINAMLNFNGYRDAIRCNDGKRMDSYNKMHLIQLYNLRHPKYFRVLHMFQAQKHGMSASHIQFDLWNNSTTNISGGKMGNLEDDLVNEFLNRYLKDMIMFPHGNQTKASIELRSKAFGVIQDLREDYDAVIKDVEPGEDRHTHHARYEKWKEDVKPAVKIILSEKLVSKEGRRSHPGFTDFQYNMTFIENISAYRDEINRLGKKIDAVNQYKSESRSQVNNLEDDMNID